MTKNDQPSFSDIDIENWKPKPSVVRRDRRKGTISVTNKVGSNRIPLKVIAPYEKWIEWEETYLSEGCINLSVISDYVTKRTRAADIGRLSEYEHDYLYKFSYEFFDLFIFPANIDNPQSELWGIKERGAVPITNDKSEKAKICYNASFLYTFISDWAKKHESSKRPKELEILGINPNEKIKPKEETQKMLGRWYPSSRIGSMDPELFYKKIVLSWRKLSKVRKIIKHRKKYYKKFFLSFRKSHEGKTIIKGRKQWAKRWPAHLPWLPQPPPDLVDLYKAAKIPFYSELDSTP
jgi:hypothetical protein